jgi:superfamily II DNA or RNA helicase
MGTTVIKLTINNSESKIIGLTLEQQKSLREKLMYRVDPQSAYFSNNHFNTKRYLLDKRTGIFPTGLLYIVKNWLSKNKLEYKELDTRIKPLRGMAFKASLRVTPYPEQENAAQSILERYRGIIAAPTGFGKSIVIALIIQKLQVRTLIVVPNLGLKDQLTKTLTDIFGDVVGGFGHAIAVENIQALDPKLNHVYDCVIIDEFHHSAADSYRKLNKKAWKYVFYRVGLTATPFRSNSNERLLLESVLSEVVYKVEYKDAVKKGYIVPLEAYYIDLPKSKVEGHTWAEVYKELVVENMYRSQIIANILANTIDNNISTLCLVKEVQHGKNLSEEIIGLPFAHGENEYCNKIIEEFNNSLIPAMVGTTGVLGEGVDTKPCEYVIIAGLGKSRNAFMQACGRALRTYPGKISAKVIIFRDSSHKWTLTHYREQIRVLREEYGIEPARLDI